MKTKSHESVKNNKSSIVHCVGVRGVLLAAAIVITSVALAGRTVRI